MSVDKRIAAFMTIAAEEIRAAKMLADGAPRQAAYDVQQAAEKATRAVPAKAGVSFGISHNLSQMADALPAGHPLHASIAALNKHSSAATRFRYPSPTGHLAPAPISNAINADIVEVERFIEAVRQHLVPTL
jgi:hypothetical protein